MSANERTKRKKKYNKQNLEQKVKIIDNQIKRPILGTDQTCTKINFSIINTLEYRFIQQKGLIYHPNTS